MNADAEAEDYCWLEQIRVFAFLSRHAAQHQIRCGRRFLRNPMTRTPELWVHSQPLWSRSKVLQSPSKPVRIGARKMEVEINVEACPISLHFQTICTRGGLRPIALS